MVENGVIENGVIENGDSDDELLGYQFNRMTCIVERDGQKQAIKWYCQNQEDRDKEADFLKKLNHSNIIKYLGTEDKCVKGRGIYGIRMEYCERDSLDRVVFDARWKYSVQMVTVWAEQLFQGLCALKEKLVVHNDIKLENILLTSDFSVKLHNFRNARNEKPRLTYHADMYSVGVILWEIFERRVPKFKMDSSKKAYVIESFDCSTPDDISTVVMNCIESKDLALEPKELLDEIGTIRKQFDTEVDYPIFDETKTEHEAPIKPIFYIRANSPVMDLDVEKISTHFDAPLQDEPGPSTSRQEQWKLGPSIGHRSRSTVYLLENRDTPAIIECFRDRDPKRFHELYANLKDIMRLNHPNILSCLELVDEAVLGSPEIALVMEYCTYGFLDNLIFNARTIYSMRTVLQWTHDLFDAITYMEKQGFVHWNIKTHNVAVNGDFVLKLAGLDEVRLFEGNRQGSMGTPRYKSPEVALKNEISLKSLVWGIGLILWEIMERTKIFDAYFYDSHGWNGWDDREELKIELEKELKKLKGPQVFRELINGCLIVDPDERLSAEEALQLFHKDMEALNFEHLASIEIDIAQKDLLRPIGFNGTEDKVMIGSSADDDGDEWGMELMGPSVDLCAEKEIRKELETGAKLQRKTESELETNKHTLPLKTYVDFPRLKSLASASKTIKGHLINRNSDELQEIEQLVQELLKQKKDKRTTISEMALNEEINEEEEGDEQERGPPKKQSMHLTSVLLKKEIEQTFAKQTEIVASTYLAFCNLLDKVKRANFQINSSLDKPTKWQKRLNRAKELLKEPIYFKVFFSLPRNEEWLLVKESSKNKTPNYLFMKNDLTDADFFLGSRVDDGFKVIDSQGVLHCMFFVEKRPIEMEKFNDAIEKLNTRVYFAQKYSNSAEILNRSDAAKGKEIQLSLPMKVEPKMRTKKR